MEAQGRLIETLDHESCFDRQESNPVHLDESCSAVAKRSGFLTRQEHYSMSLEAACSCYRVVLQSHKHSPGNRPPEEHCLS